MYENISKHPDCPPDNVINNDDLLDGWMIIEKQKREKEQTTAHVNDRLQGRHQKADEVFLPAKTKEEIDRIKNMNDTRGHMIKAQRNAAIKAKGKVVDADFMDRKLQIQTEANQQFIQHARGKK